MSVPMMYGDYSLVASRCDALSPDRRQNLPFAALLLFFAMLLLRPWDHWPGLAVARPMLLLMVVAVVLFIRSRPQIEFFRVRPAPLLLAFFAVICLSVPSSYWPTKSLSIASDYLKQIALFVMIVNLVTTLRRLTQFLMILAVGCAFHGGLAIYNFTFGEFEVDERLEGIGGAYFRDPNDLALALVLIFPFAWWLTSVLQSRVARGAMFGCLTLLVGGIVATQSRGGLLALLAAAFVLALQLDRTRRSLLVLTFVLSIVLSAVILPAGVFDRYLTIGSYQQDESAMARLAVWKAGARMFADHMLTGTGAGTFEVVYGQHYIDRAGAGNVWRAAHSSYIEIAAELGIAGLTIWLLILASAFRSLAQAGRLLDYVRHESDGEAKMLADQLRQWVGALLATMVGFVVGAAFLSRGYDLLLCVVLALVAVTLRSAEELANIGDDVSHRQP